MQYEEELTGNWEEPGIIGSRIEIADSQITFLWQGGVVLQTTFTAAETDGGQIVLSLRQNGLRCQGSDRDYAAVERLYYESGRLHCIKNFPLSGLSEEIMTLTDKSRYGYVTINDDLLANVQGTWRDVFSGETAFTIIGDEMTLDGQTIPVHAAVHRSRNRGEQFAIIHQDPAVHQIGYFMEMIFLDDTVKGYVPVCDAGVHEMTFKPE